MQGAYGDNIPVLTVVLRKGFIDSFLLLHSIRAVFSTLFNSGSVHNAS